MRHLLALTDVQMTTVMMAAAPLPQNIRSKVLQAVAYQCPVNDSALVDAIAVALAALGFAEDGSKLISHQQEEKTYDQTTAAAR